MPLITFTSDYGLKDHYVASVKATLLQLDIHTPIIDISHQVPSHNLAYAAHVIRNVYQQFPLGTIHILAIDTTSSKDYLFLAAKINDHIFVGPNNGILSIIGDNTPDEVVILNTSKKSSFPGKECLAEAALKLYQGFSFSVIGKPTTKFVTVKNKEVNHQNNKISGQVIHIDNYGNAITNITKDLFDALNSTLSLSVTFKRELLTSIHTTYNEVNEADCVAFFNNANLLEIAINQGSASQLLGLRYDDPIEITFQ
ncbi:MAG: S-adenosyl-l-methionine hydroxide adenosyltransferase family protein [Cyclobacteriaceae bacterium]